MANDQPGTRLSPKELRGLYAARRYLSSEIETKLGLRVPADVYFQDPLVAEQDPELGFEEAHVAWEPGLGDGPTSGRFAVVDYNADSRQLTPPACWDKNRHRFVHDGRVLDRSAADTLQFHQVHVWAVVQRALSYFESADALGRPIPWGFDGNRLLVVPHAGYGENAYYDRTSKSLQFYYFDREGRRTYTCLSADIIHHELAHAVLDGARPLLIESSSVETAAFHEFVGDLTAILLALRNTSFRMRLAERTAGDLSAAENISSIAEEFGARVKDRPYLRSGRNAKTMAEVKGSRNAHLVSEVMTGAMFDVILALSRHYVEQRNRTPAQAFWDTIQRMQRTALQPLDLLPPTDVTFRDYALAVLRVEELANPRDPHGYRDLMLQAFVGRGILDAADMQELQADDYVYQRLPLGVFHEVGNLAASRAAAYRFLDDNRRELLLPADRDVVVQDLYSAQRFARQARRLPRQTVLQYVWREEVPLQGRRFAELDGRTASLPCGGTLVLDQDGNVLWWRRKPGPAVAAGVGGGRSKAEAEAGEARRERFLSDVEERVTARQLGDVPGGARGLLGTHVPPFTSRTVDGAVRFELTPHLGLSEDDAPEEGERRWQISS